MRRSVQKEATLSEVLIGQEPFYKIAHVDAMKPFFMSIVSDANHWLFVGSNGGVSAGRKSAEYALFPYYTDDKIIESAELTGPKTILRVESDEHVHLWEPFSIRTEVLYTYERNVYKSRYGNKIIFEEINTTLGIAFAYEWNTSARYGFVRKATLQNRSTVSVRVAFVDGIQNILPYGVSPDLQQASSNLADAYKRSELLASTGLGIFALSAIIVDKAEPSEALKANVVWQLGLESPTYLLSTRQLDTFRAGGALQQEEDSKGQKAAYFAATEKTLIPGAKATWYLVANVNQSQSSVIALAHTLATNTQLEQELRADIEAGTQRLITLTASADGLQFSADERLNARHYANTLFNVMRGGIFDDNYTIDPKDFKAYLKQANTRVYQQYANQLPTSLDVFRLKALAEASGDTAFVRLATEYLPLRFSRRHGDPSRPWNRFTINTHSEADGSKILDYEGNWRDIFQNWEALAHSYPEFIEGMIYKFLNASTFDGYNPYRVTKGGFDWETIEPDNPWSYIGYWGDHQVIYLQKFLEFAQSHSPELLSGLLSKNGFVYANVPYLIKPYAQILQNPKDTIGYDHAAEAALRQRIKGLGSDGALLTTASGEEIHTVNFTEKLLAMLLAKLTNFVPDGGIWMNTQRPEWNDANNALVGNGLSMVTLYYIRRFLVFAKTLFTSRGQTEFPLSEELLSYFEQAAAIFQQYAKTAAQAPLNEVQKKAMLDALGEAAGAYREGVYAHRFSGKTKTVAATAIGQFMDDALALIETSIRNNKRPDGLYHTYNILSYDEKSLRVSYLSEMLEGQVGVLSSGALDARESLDVLVALRASALYRPDQDSYILYPNKALPKFLEKNQVPAEAVESIPLLLELLAEGGAGVLDRDIHGDYHFNGGLRNANDLEAALSKLDSSFQSAVAQDKAAILELYEQVFNHKAFTGRSGTFYAYEGLGSIYWHMVSKLLLAVQEICYASSTKEVDNTVRHALYDYYHAIRKGIGAHKSPQEYGAFPTDPYSHTPLGRGAQQPGMTGQVKEDIISRFGELGVSVVQGQIAFKPYLLRRSEFYTEEQEITYVDVAQQTRTLLLPVGSLCFTYCQVPVVYTLADQNSLTITYADGRTTESSEPTVDAATSRKLFGRTGEVVKVSVLLTPHHLL